jgi:adenylate cyclase
MNQKSILKQWIWQWRGILVATPTIGGLVLLLRLAGFWQSWEWAAFDQFIRLRPAQGFDDRIVIVGIDEHDLREIGQPIIPDGIYADLIDKIKAQQPRSIGLDIYRDLPVQPGHDKLVKVFESTPNLVGIQKVVGRDGQETVAPPPALKAKGQVGSNDLLIDADGKVRRGFLSVDTNQGETIYSFSLHLGLHYLAAQQIGPEQIPDSQTWRLGKATFQPFESNDGGYVRADAGGYQQIINYRSGKRSFKTVPLRDVLKNRLPQGWGRDRVILIGTVGESFQDAFFTPYTSGLISLPRRMPGVEVHAHLVSQILSAAIDNRPLIRAWSEPIEYLWIFAWTGVGAVLTWQFRTMKRQRWILQIGSWSLAAGTLLGSAYWAICQGLWIPVVPTFIGMLGATAAITVYIARSAGDIRKTFGRYLSDEIVATLLENPSGLALGGERRTITILTSDLRGFTAFAERTSPEQVVKLLNFYLEHMAEVITHYQGTIDEFMGDGILVLFGAPTARPDDAERAIAAAVAMQLELVKVNQTMQEWGFPLLEMGIGINTGEVVVGNIGSEKRSKYGVVGSQVNLTYRIESYTTGGQILISASTLEQAGEHVQLIGQRDVKPKGVQEPITIYEVGGIGGAYNLSLPQTEMVFLPLREKIAVYYAPIDGKQVSETQDKGWLTQLSEKGALLYYDQNDSITPLTNLKMNLELGDSQEDVYAKVLELPADPNHFYIQFTAKPPAIAAQLDQLYKELQSI